MQARWNPEYEDRWYFDAKNRPGENNVYLKIGDYDEKKDSNLQLCIELVLHYVTNATKSG